MAGFEMLAELALDLRWSWNHSADHIWRQLDPELWELTHNPWVVLQTVAGDKIRHLFADPELRNSVESLLQQKHNAAQKPGWFQQTYPDSDLTRVAYFSMEFMLSEALPIYSGGLGNVAADQLKAASDLGVPVIGVGLLYQQGYFRQLIDKDGAQQAVYPYNDTSQLPITPLRQANGEWLRLPIDLPGCPVWIRVWQVQVGSTQLYLLDSNDTANCPAYRAITSELYGGTPELRLLQELVLGIAGWRLLGALGIEVQVCHLNEGHAALAVLERARCFMVQTGQSFAVALAVTRAGNLFTTHTAVAAGFDRYTPELIEHCLGEYSRNQLGITLNELLALGRQNPDDASENFNMAYLAMRGSGAVNGVSCLHGRVSRHLFAPLFPGWPVNEVPVGHITNGVHTPSWDSAAADQLWTEACGKGRWLGTTAELEQIIRRVPDGRLWQLRNDARQALVDFVQHQSALQSLQPQVLTLGFARRFATYKRPNLLLHDPDRLLRLLTNAERPVQLILAGKAHPADLAGQALIQQWIQFIRRPEASPHVIFLADHDMLLTERLVQGVDVWLNTPERPWEASGTSGMKVLVNGGINLSELDGWWVEAYSPEVGWALGDGQEHGNDPGWDAHEAEALYDLLEQEVIPAFYSRAANGIPVAWVTRMRESMARLTPQFSTNRVVREYTEQHYLPAATAYHQRAENHGAIGLQIVGWQHELQQKWTMLRFGEVQRQTVGEQYLFEIQIYLDSVDPAAISVELYADAGSIGTPVRQAMQCITPPQNPGAAGVYRGQVPATRSVDDYTVRIVPCREGVMVPLEFGAILWQS